MGTRSFPGVKRPGRDDGHPPPSSAKVEGKELAIHLLPFWAFVGCSRIKHTFVFIRKKGFGSVLPASERIRTEDFYD
jgi:hypothetical protein